MPQCNAVRTIVLISGVKKKLRYAAPAIDLYISALFKGYLRFAKRLSPDLVMILSAKYGLLNLDTVTESYEKTLRRMPASEVQDWGAMVLEQLGAVSDIEQDRFILLAGEAHRKALIAHLRHVEVPFAGLGLGQQLRILKGVE